MCMTYTPCASICKANGNCDIDIIINKINRDSSTQGSKTRLLSNKRIKFTAKAVTASQRLNIVQHLSLSYGNVVNTPNKIVNYPAILKEEMK